MHYHDQAMEDERQIRRFEFWRNIVQYRRERFQRILNMTFSQLNGFHVPSTYKIVPTSVSGNLRVTAAELEQVIEDWLELEED